MPTLLSILPYVLVPAAVLFLFLKIRQHRRRKVINELTSGINLLGHWTYTAPEWLRAVEVEFKWATGKGHTGEVFISPHAVYVRTERADRFIDLVKNGRVVTNASFRGAPDSPLKLRVRWKVTTRHGGRDHVKYHKEDFRIPVPRGAIDAATKVADFFTLQIENNMEAYTNLVDEDEPISLFGRDDSF